MAFIGKGGSMSAKLAGTVALSTSCGLVTIALTGNMFEQTTEMLDLGSQTQIATLLFGSCRQVLRAAQEGQESMSKARNTKGKIHDVS